MKEKKYIIKKANEGYLKDKDKIHYSYLPCIYGILILIAIVLLIFAIDNVYANQIDTQSLWYWGDKDYYNFSDPEFPYDRNISCNMSENYIKWYWNFTNASVFIDGTLINSDNDLGYYMLQCGGNERHRIDVYDSQNSTLWYSEVTSKHSFLLFYLPLICLVLFIFALGYFYFLIYLLTILPSTVIMVTAIQETISWITILSAFFIVFAFLFFAYAILEQEK